MIKYPIIPVAQTLILSCLKFDFFDVVISPGSRNVPLAIGFASNKKFKCYSIVDERSAAFFALGLSQKSKKPTILVCTSGSALLNYYPAVAEAYYSEIPLIILSADRPEYKINIGDGQTINQSNVFEKNILYSNSLKQDCSHATVEIIKSNLQKIVNDEADFSKIEKLQKSVQKNNQEIIEIAFNLSINKMQPVHLNVPMEEPLYEFNDSPSISVKVKKKTEKKPSLTDLDNFYKVINKASKIMILIGVSDGNILSKKSIQKINSCSSIIVMKEHTSNVFNESFISNIDRLIGPIELQSKSDSVFDELSPEIVISLGGMIVSKKLKSFLRNYKPRKHFHIGNNISKDSFYSGVKHIKTTANKFFENIDLNKSDSKYFDKWNRLNSSKLDLHNQYMKVINFSDLKVFEILTNCIPKKYNIQVSNSTPIRYFQLFDLKNKNMMFANRGTSGIDGSTSTAIGSSIQNDSPVLLVTGDLSFFYDVNALWNNHIPKNFRIIIINNSGGGIFKILPGFKENNLFSEFIETQHNLSARLIAKMFNFNYTRVSTKFGLNLYLRTFFKNSKKPKILEIKTSSVKSTKILKDYFRYLSKP
ncbi:MAG: 2-succinyl-5-enolpyruvyl-6-hydroxy-3-cyclohexene-1-carboxylate synthase [Flavobacteriaceae bacterium]|nr:2-succinyl-5-enolpyruvyl-6-hydroxy-3-cyclohexene-1-carboxylate synthase [Flavobacteriaceae bacterium]|tara:strand:- start:6411 stop:8180 length:1770 start_codon:yes stop_codon:yes gene_type:complete